MNAPPLSQADWELRYMRLQQAAAALPPPGSGASPFDDYICNECNQLHLQFSPRVARWLLDQLNR